VDDAHTAWVGRSTSREALLAPRIGVIESESDIQILVELPGLRPVDLEVKVEDDTLTI